MKTTNWIIALATVMNAFIFFYSINKPFAKANVRVERQNQLNVYESWGKVCFLQYMDLKNVGNKDCYISKIECYVKNKENNSINFKYKAEGFSSDLKIGSESPFLNHNLLPGQSLSGYFDFFNVATTNEYEIESKFKNTIYEYLDSCFQKNGSISCVDNKTFTPIQQYIKNKMNSISEGEYDCIIQVYKNDEKLPFYSKCFYFLLYYSDLQRMSNELSSLKKGMDIYINSANTLITQKEQGTWAITTDIENNEIIEQIKKEIQ